MQHRSYTLEVPIDTLSAAMAVGPHVTRLEVCAQLDRHGFTPPLNLVREICHNDSPHCDCVVMIRPDEGARMSLSRTGVQSAHEEIRALSGTGAKSATFGVLNKQGQLDLDANALLAQTCRECDLEPCLHRAFDFHPSIEEAVEIAADIGIVRVLSAGTSSLDLVDTVLNDRLNRIAETVAAAKNRFQVIAAGGVRADNAHAFLACTPHLHSSCRIEGQLCTTQLSQLLSVMNHAPQ